MSAFIVANPYPVILSLSGTGLNGGQVYIGVANQDPQSFPQAVYWDSALTTPASQPLAVTGGYVTRSGTPAVPYVAGLYSIKVLNAQGVQVYYNAAVAPDGEYLESQVLIANAISLTTNTSANITSLALTAGDWDVSGTIVTTSTTASIVQGGISTVSATQPTSPNNGGFMNLSLSGTTTFGGSFPVGTKRLALTAPATVYLVVFASFTSTNSAYGAIRARRNSQIVPT